MCGPQVLCSSPFVCQWCSPKLSRNIIQQLQSEVASLKQELMEPRQLPNHRAGICTCNCMHSFCDQILNKINIFPYSTLHCDFPQDSECQL